MINSTAHARYWAQAIYHGDRSEGEGRHCKGKTRWEDVGSSGFLAVAEQIRNVDLRTTGELTMVVASLEFETVLVSIAICNLLIPSAA